MRLHIKLTVLVLVFFKYVLGNEEQYHWLTPCIYQEPQQCGQETTTGYLSCGITRYEPGESCNPTDPVGWDEIPDKPDILDPIIYTPVRYNSDTGQNETHIGIHLKWTLDTSLETENIEGFEVSLVGLTYNPGYDYDYYGQKLCVFFNVSSADLVAYRDGNIVSYYFDCYRPVSPYCEYSLSVRTLPTTDEYSPDKGTGPDSTISTVRFPIPSCADDRIIHTYECNNVEEGEEAAHWTPQYYLVSSPNYHTINLTFDLPDPDFGLTYFKVSLQNFGATLGNCWGYPFFEEVSPMSEDTLVYTAVINGYNTTFMTYIITDEDVMGEFKGKYCVNMLPDGPDSPCGIEGHPDQQCLTNSDRVTVLDDPCNPENPCKNGTCIGLMEKYHYTCDCHPGYVSTEEENSTCVVNACFGNPCGLGGVCNTELSSEEYTCNCSVGYYEDQGTCKYDFCYVNNCSPGDCLLNGTTGYTCNCTEDYFFDGIQCAKMDDPGITIGSIIAMVVGILLGVILIIFAIAYLGYWKSTTRKENGEKSPFNNYSENNMQENPGMNGIISGSELNLTGIVVARDEPQNPKVLVLYTADCELHNRLIHEFALFLRDQFGCIVKCKLWDTAAVANSVSDWIFEALREVDKVVVVASTGTLKVWEERDTVQEIGNVANSIFKNVMVIISNDLREQQRCNKFASVYFQIHPYSEHRDIPDPLKHVGKCFKLSGPGWKEMKDLYLFLCDLSEASSTGGYRTIENRCSSEEGRKFRGTLAKMKEYVLSNPDWYEQCQQEDNSLETVFPISSPFEYIPAHYESLTELSNEEEEDPDSKYQQLQFETCMLGSGPKSAESGNTFHSYHTDDPMEESAGTYQQHGMMIQSKGESHPPYLTGHHVEPTVLSTPCEDDNDSNFSSDFALRQNMANSPTDNHSEHSDYSSQNANASSESNRQSSSSTSSSGLGEELNDVNCNKKLQDVEKPIFV